MRSNESTTPRAVRRPAFAAPAEGGPLGRRSKSDIRAPRSEKTDYPTVSGEWTPSVCCATSVQHSSFECGATCCVWPLVGDVRDRFFPWHPAANPIFHKVIEPGTYLFRVGGLEYFDEQAKGVSVRPQHTRSELEQFVVGEFRESETDQIFRSLVVHGSKLRDLRQDWNRHIVRVGTKERPPAPLDVARLNSLGQQVPRKDMAGNDGGCRVLKATVAMGGSAYSGGSTCAAEGVHMDANRHGLLNALGYEVKMSTHRAAVTAGVSVEVLVQVALGREVWALREENLATVRAELGNSVLISSLSVLSNSWPTAEAAPPGGGVRAPVDQDRPHSDRRD